MSRVSFDATTEERVLISAVVDRIMNASTDPRRDRLDYELDLRATNANGCPLDFERLLSFDHFNFWHDIGGIARHLNRRTGKLENFFIPRCARPAPVEDVA